MGSVSGRVEHGRGGIGRRGVRACRRAVGQRQRIKELAARVRPPIQGMMGMITKIILYDLAIDLWVGAGKSPLHFILFTAIIC